MTLKDETGKVMDSVSYSTSTSGISLNRANDGEAGVELINHDDVEGATTDLSPGTRADGSA